MREFEELKILNLSGNPICRNTEYFNYAVSYLPNKLKYLDYRLLDKDVVNAARKLYIDGLIALEEEEKILNHKVKEARVFEEQETLYQVWNSSKIEQSHRLNRWTI